MGQANPGLIYTMYKEGLQFGAFAPCAGTLIERSVQSDRCLMSRRNKGGARWRVQRFRHRAQAPGDCVPSSGDKGLKKNAIGFVSSVVIGVASTAPGYSLAATLGFIAAAVALQSPAILLIASSRCSWSPAAYYYMNKADPDCGTSFSWVTKAMGPQLGWIDRLGDHRRRRHRDGEPGPDRRPLHLPPLRPRRGRRLDRSR